MTIREYGERPDVAHHNAYALDSAIEEQMIIGGGHQSEVHPQEWWSQKVTNKYREPRDGCRVGMKAWRGLRDSNPQKGWYDAVSSQSIGMQNVVKWHK